MSTRVSRWYDLSRRRGGTSVMESARTFARKGTRGLVLQHLKHFMQRWTHNIRSGWVRASPHPPSYPRACNSCSCFIVMMSTSMLLLLSYMYTHTRTTLEKVFMHTWSTRPNTWLHHSLGSDYQRRKSQRCCQILYRHQKGLPVFLKIFLNLWSYFFLSGILSVWHAHARGGEKCFLVWFEWRHSVRKKKKKVVSLKRKAGIWNGSSGAIVPTPCDRRLADHVTRGHTSRATPASPAL